MPRNLSFDPEEKLNEAMFVFWQSGYAETSVSQLTKALAVNKFSLYQQFGSKDALYLKSLERYEQKIYKRLLKPLETRQGMASLLDYFENFSVQVSKDSAKFGCLINNTLLAGPSLPTESRQAAKVMVGELRTLLKENFEIAKNQGELGAKPDDCLNFTLMTIQALLNTRKTLGSLVMQGNLRFFLQQLRKW